MKLTKSFEFHSAHYLEQPQFDVKKNFETFGACSGFSHSTQNGGHRKYHGHCYKMQVDIEGSVDSLTGFLINFKDLKQIVNTTVVDVFDHNSLNDVMALEYWPVTVENMLGWIVKNTALLHDIDVKSDSRAEVTAIRIWETEDSVAEWRKGDDN